ncbi:PLP-dependent aminotransferase family protein [Brenneria izadpanahii]|uniref:PLP-dependent aminotransferase family protein n=1 Tax=Brenneria izadpanahii TaxID=2722756 RepID=A0ABX7URX8_9GAMM|nr:PLP-dependent aminotransferase family protein [Brenneria izadpanahii]QTF08496.1 PLP-dependent aminotransferase family protein [Brenneria izadpanahii]
MNAIPFDPRTLFRPGLPEPTSVWQGMADITFNAGHNAPELIPLEGLVSAAQIAIRREGRSLAIYNQGHGPQGNENLRRFVSQKLATRGITADIEDILITSGSGPALDLVNNLLLTPGDTVLMEAFSYAGALRKLRGRQVNIVAIPLDDEGIRIDALETILEELSQRGVTPKFIYTIPTVQNPTGAILGLARRHQLLQLAARYRTLIVEDECYADIVWQGHEAPPALYALSPQQVIHVGSFSKTLAPAVRVAYLSASPVILRHLVSLKTDGGTGALDQIIIAEYFASHFDAHIRRLRATLARKLAVLTAAVRQELGDSVRLWLPKGGIFLWLALPEGVDTRTLVEPAAAVGVAFNPGPDWAVDGDAAQNWLRLCFALESEAQIRTGVARLAGVLRQHPLLAEVRKVSV